MSLLTDVPNRIENLNSNSDVNQLIKYTASLGEMLSKLSKDLEFVVNGNIDKANIKEKSIDGSLININSLDEITKQLGIILSGTINNLTTITLESNTIETHGFKITDKVGFNTIFIDDSVATTVTELVQDFNILLNALKGIGILSE